MAAKKADCEKADAGPGTNVMFPQAGLQSLAAAVDGTGPLAGAHLGFGRGEVCSCFGGGGRGT